MESTYKMVEKVHRDTLPEHSLFLTVKLSLKYISLFITFCKTINVSQLLKK